MSIVLLVSAVSALLALGYCLYGRFLSRLLALRKEFPTPAHEFKDNVDFLPVGKWYLLGQQLSAIAAAGPIVGPIVAGMWFGWFPTLLWIILGGIFIGGVHDMFALVASVRHQGRSIAEVIRENMGPRAWFLFLLFLWFSIVYIVTAFTDITASTFIEETKGAQVASSSMLYLVLALVMGGVLKKFKPPLLIATLLFVPLIFVCIYLGQFMPLRLPSLFGLNARASWDVALLAYCFIAAIIPVWLLLQPRGYLGGFFLALTAGISFLGLLAGGLTEKLVVTFPAFIGWRNPAGLPLLPLLFTTVACGACSGFHAIVSSGTTSKQIDKEPDATLVGYGGMLLESFVAVMALATLLMVSQKEAQLLRDPSQIFASGIAAFLKNLGIPKDFALNFALLAFATFVYDTLDVATRLGRYIVQELMGWKGKAGSYAATLLTLLLPLIFVTRQIRDAQGAVIPAWKAFWTIFGSSNQLLAAMVLLGISVWLFKARMKYWVSLVPSFFMIAVAMVSLFLILKPWFLDVLRGRFVFEPMTLAGFVLLLLSCLLIIEGALVFLKRKARL